MLVTCSVYIGYCMVARRYEFYDRVARKIYCSAIKIRIFQPKCNVLLLYRHADDGVFDNFPRIFEDFLKIVLKARSRFLYFKRLCQTTACCQDNNMWCSLSPSSCFQCMEQTTGHFSETDTISAFKHKIKHCASSFYFQIIMNQFLCILH